MIDPRFEKEVSPSGKVFYIHKENAKKREDICSDLMSGKITKEEFEKIQNKMRNKSFLRHLYTEKDYLKYLDSNPYSNQN